MKSFSSTICVLVWLGVVSAVASEHPNDLVTLGKELQTRVVELRGLTIKKPILWKVTTKEQVRAYLKKTLDEQYAPGEMEREGDAWKALGLIPRDMDYRNFIISLYEEQVGGYYDPKKEVFYLAEWIAPSLQETVIVHELTHALQDQHFDIDKFIDRIRGNSDAMYARAAVIEGEATLVMMLDALRNTGMKVDPAVITLDSPMVDFMMSLSSGGFPILSSAPEALAKTLMFPYVSGLDFINFGLKRGGFTRINAVYQDLPASTEQILHPEKYFIERDRPTNINLKSVKDLVPEAWTLIFQETMGEFMTRQILATLADEGEKRAAAAGWDGDQVWVYKRGDELAWVQLSVWDSVKDSIEFAGAFAKTVTSRLPDSTLLNLTKEPQMIWTREPDRAVIVRRKDQKVIIVENLPRRVAEKIVKMVLAG